MCRYVLGGGGIHHDSNHHHRTVEPGKGLSRAGCAMQSGLPSCREKGRWRGWSGGRRPSECITVITITVGRSGLRARGESKGSGWPHPCAQLVLWMLVGRLSGHQGDAGRKQTLQTWEECSLHCQRRGTGPNNDAQRICSSGLTASYSRWILFTCKWRAQSLLFISVASTSRTGLSTPGLGSRPCPPPVCVDEALGTGHTHRYRIA